ncbi:MAG: sigma-70 family RNA polymerase sigma factor [Lewinellaceae bacterium]|nr:sigma-70 family RNA polymerase sigma factor [Phaeodactylibacter sp.]MCB9036756.1 sigma-70 family RNA polymerase sigma factor [Lewinellaceae bacterium]
MHDCKRIIDKMRNGGEEGIAEGMALLVEDIEFRKTAKYFYGRYRQLSRVLSWEDLLYEAVLRLATEISNGRGPKTNCKGYIRNICRNICEEYRRESQRMDMAMDVLSKLYHSPSSNVLREKVKAYLAQLGGQCEVLLWLCFFEEPPVEDHGKLAGLLNDKGYDVSPTSVSSLLSRCKRKFRELLGGGPSGLFEE